MDQLRVCLAKVKEQLERHHNEFLSNEAMTRRYVVDPVLEGLGWHGLSRVRVEQTTLDGRPDYTLLHDGTPTISVEAKAAGRSLTRGDIQQLARYCYQDTGVPYGVLTNGAQWVLFDPFLQGRPFAERVIWEIDLRAIAVQEAAAELSLIAYEAVGRLRAETDLRAALSSCWESLWADEGEIASVMASALIRRIGSERPAISAGLDPGRVLRFVAGELSSRQTNVPRTGGARRSDPEGPPQSQPQQPKRKATPTAADATARRNRPTRVAVGGHDCGGGAANKVLIETAEWLIKQGNLTAASCPIATARSRSRYIVSETPVHRNGETFRGGAKATDGHQLSNGLFLETNSTGPACEKQARALLEHFGYTPSSAYLTVDWSN